MFPNKSDDDITNYEGRCIIKNQTEVVLHVIGYIIHVESFTPLVCIIHMYEYGVLLARSAVVQR